MAICDSEVLTGQQGLIQFKPLGTTNCIDDFCPFVGTRIYLPCNSDYSIGDCIEVETVKIASGSGQSPDGGVNVIKDGDQFWVVNRGFGGEDDVDACSNSVNGVPYIEVSFVEDGSPITWDDTHAGVVQVAGVLTGDLTVSVGGSGYNSGAAGVLQNVELVAGGGTSNGTGATAEVEVNATGEVIRVTITSGGKGYAAGDMLGIEAENGVGTDAQIQVPAAAVTDIRGGSIDGSYTLRLCEFQTVCNVRDFSVDLSRDELDVTVLPCDIDDTCGKQLTAFRKTQAGFATATGTLTVYFTCDQSSLANKLLTGSLQKNQAGATVRLFVCTKTTPQGDIDEDASLFIEADIQLLGLSFSVNPDDPTNAEINFGITSVKSAFGLS